MLSLLLSVLQAFTPSGPHRVTHRFFEYDALDITSRTIAACFPADNISARFPLVAFAHGFDDIAFESYTAVFEEIASWGYVVVGPRACMFGCLSDCVNELADPPCYGHYYIQLLLTAGWTNTSAASLLPINHTTGMAVVGHSMGGQAALFASARNASQYNMRAAVLMHAFTHTFPTSRVPFLAFTGTADEVASPWMAKSIFNSAAHSCLPRALVNKMGANHHEPTTAYNPKMVKYSVAWLKIYLDGTPMAHAVDWHALIFGVGANSLCGGGDGAMRECRVLSGEEDCGARGAPSVIDII